MTHTLAISAHFGGFFDPQETNPSHSTSMEIARPCAKGHSLASGPFFDHSKLATLQVQKFPLEFAGVSLRQEWLTKKSPSRLQNVL
jgi:hypothetical protein